MSRRSACDCGGGACWPCWSRLISGVLADPLVWRVAWQLSPGLIVCALFWLAVLRRGIDCFHETDLAWSRRFVLLGMVGLGLNATVTLANGGFMPVLDDTVSRSVWVTATDRHALLFLADQYAGFSIGDVCILGSLLARFVYWCARPRPRARRAEVMS
jgi:hypothetical protein